MQKISEELKGFGLDDELVGKISGLFEARLDEERAVYEKEKDGQTAEFERLRLESAVEIALLKAGGKNLRVLGALIDRDRLSLNEGVVNGLDEQIASLRADEETGFLFTEGRPKISGCAIAEEGADMNGGLSYEQFCEMAD